MTHPSAHRHQSGQLAPQHRGASPAFRSVAGSLRSFAERALCKIQHGGRSLICDGPRRSQIALPETRARLDGMCHALSVCPAASRGELAARRPACFHQQVRLPPRSSPPYTVPMSTTQSISGALCNFHVCKDIRLIASCKCLTRLRLSRRRVP